MDVEGLSIICAGLGFAEEDEKGIVTGYSKSEYCLDNLKDLQRFLRRDDPQRRDVFKQICKWNTVSRDLIPIIEHYQSERNLVINAVKILVFLTMPIDPTSDDIAQQIEYLWGLKAAMTRNVMIAVIVSLLEDPLEHLECDVFTEDDWKLVQLVLTLFRNILAIQDVTLQQKASGSATQFLCLIDTFLELMFQENVMDLILVLVQHVDDSSGYLQEDNLLFLEIFHYIFLHRDPESIAWASKKGCKGDGDIITSIDSLRSIMQEEADKRRTIKPRKLQRHTQFSGTFTRLSLDGSKTFFKGTPASASGNGLPKIRKSQRGPLKRTAWDHSILSLQKENILELLHNFLEQFLTGGYNVLMQSVHNCIKKEHQSIQNADVTTFFQVADFVVAFQYQEVSISKKPDIGGPTSEASLDDGNVGSLSFHGDVCGPVATTMTEAMFHLVISKWREVFDGLKETNNHKFLSVAGSLMKHMIRMLDLVLKLLPEDSKEPQTARILLYKIFYDQTDQGLTQFVLNLFKSFDTHKQPKSDLADLMEIIHIVLQLMEELQARGTLRVSRKSRKGRKKKILKDNGNIDSEKLGEQNSSPTNDTAMPTSESSMASSKLTKEQLKESDLAHRQVTDTEGTQICNPDADPGMPLQDTTHLRNVPSLMGGDKLNNHIDLAYETADSSSDDQLPPTTEVEFNVSRLVASFANAAVIHNLGWLLKHYRSNPTCTNHYIISMLRRFCDDLDISPMFFQLSLLTTFYEILAQQKSSPSKEYASIVDFLTKFVRKMLKLIKKQPLLFVEILFWKTRKECQCINADALKCDLANLKEDVRNLNNGGDSLSNNRAIGQRSVADSLGDDEADFVMPYDLDERREQNSSDEACEIDLDKTKQSMGKRDKMNSISNTGTEKDISDGPEGISSDFQTKKASKRQKGSVFNQEQEATIKNLYEKYKDERRCSRLIAETLDPDGKISPVLVSRKLKQLGLKTASRKKAACADLTYSAGDDQTRVGSNVFSADANFPNPDEHKNTSSYLEESSHRRKRVRAFNKEQEHEIKILFERFKNHKKCSHMIAKALDADNTYTAAQVLRKLRQLGLVASQDMRSPKTVKPLTDEEGTGRYKQSDEDTLLTIKQRSQKKKRKSLVKKATPMSRSQHEEASTEHDSGDETLIATFNKRKKPSVKEVLITNEPQYEETSLEHDPNKESTMSNDMDTKHESVPSHGHEVTDFAPLEDDIEPELENLSNDKLDDLEDLVNSEDDMRPSEPKKIGFKRNLKLVIDEDDE